MTGLELASSSAAGAFGQLKWAFLFLGLSLGPTLTINKDRFNLDLLPDFLGYLFFALAAHRLQPFDRTAKRIRNLALILAFLALPTCIQYVAVSPQRGVITYWIAPLRNLSLVLGLLDMVLVWQLGGLIVRLGLKAGVMSVVDRARDRRLAYAMVRLLNLGLVAISDEAAAPVPCIWWGFLVLNVIMLFLMMGLMNQARQLCELGALWVEASGTPEGKLGRRLFRLGVAIVLLVPAGMATAWFRYYAAWKEVRQQLWNKGEDQKELNNAIGKFWDAMGNERFDEAHALMTRQMQARVSGSRLEQLARPIWGNKKGRFSLAGGGGGDRNTWVYYDHTDPNGTVFRIVVGAGRPMEEDSIFRKELPPIGIDKFDIAPANEGDPFPFFPR